MVDPRTISVTADQRGVAVVTLSRPERRNAISSEMISELASAAGEVASDPSIRAVVLSAEGDIFCAGADLDWMRSQFDAEPEEQHRQAARFARLLNTWNVVPKPVIARVQGNAYGGGLGLMAVADVVCADENARFGLSETRLGLIPATISPYLLARLGEAGARRMFLSGKPVGGREAVDLGLVSRSVPPAELDAAVKEEVDACLACAPGAVADAKAMLRRIAGEIPEELIDATAGWLAGRWQDPEAQEGMTAFFERRKPAWTEGT